MPVRFQEFTGYGSVELLGWSVKSNRGSIDDRRSTWWFRPDPSTSPGLVAERFGDSGLAHDDTADLVGRAGTGASGFVLAAGDTPRVGKERCRVYAAGVIAPNVAGRPPMGHPPIGWLATRAVRLSASMEGRRCT